MFRIKSEYIWDTSGYIRDKVRIHSGWYIWISRETFGICRDTVHVSQDTVWVSLHWDINVGEKSWDTGTLVANIPTWSYPPPKRTWFLFYKVKSKTHSRRCLIVVKNWSSMYSVLTVGMFICCRKRKKRKRRRKRKKRKKKSKNLIQTLLTKW